MKKILLTILCTLLSTMSWAQGTTAGDETSSEAYAVLMSGENNDITATLYYDENRNSHTEGFATVGMDELMQSQAWSMNRENITTVTIDSSFANYRPTSTSFWFAYCRSLTTISGLEHLNTEAVTDMSFMFNYCAALTSLDLSFFNTENVTNFAGMLGNCSSLTSIDLSSFYTRQATDMNSMFEQSSSLVTINLSSFNTSQVTNMSYMFNECSALTTIYVGSDWSTESVTNSENMFKACTNLVGGAGTTFNSEYITASYARIDGGTSAPGYLTEQDASSTHYVLITVEGNGEVSAGMADVIRDKGDVHVADGEPLEMFFFPDEGYQLASVKIDTLDVTSQVTPATEYSAASYTIPGVYGDIAITVTFAQTSTDAEAYAVLSDSNTVLTFYYDYQKEANNGMSVGPFASTGDVPWYANRGTITKVVFDESFANCTSLTSTAYWFCGMSALTSVEGINSLKTDNVTDMTAMFYFCSGLTSLDVSGFKTDNVTDMRNMFYGCSSLTSLDVSGFKTGNVTNMSGMFYGCSGLTTLDVSGFNTAKVKNMRVMFSSCSSLTNIDLSHLNTENVTDMSEMFSYCDNLTSLDLSHFNTENVTNMYRMFAICSSLTNIDLSYFNTAKVRNMREMFSSCSSLTNIDLSHLNTENVTDMYSMFSSCSSLTSLDLSHFNTAKVTRMSFMFRACTGLTNLDISHFNTEMVGEMDYMFYGCSGLTSLDVSGFNTANVTDMRYMFDGCSSLTSLDVSGFNTAKVKNMSDMFIGCSSLTSLDLSRFNTAKVTSMGGMFSSCSALKTIYAGSEWTTDAVDDGFFMFNNCSNLVGGAGTVYDANHIDYTYAHIDGGENNPGYFTAKNAAGTFDIRVSVYGNGEVSVGNLPDVIVDGKSAVASVDAGGSLEMFFFPLDGYQIGSVVLDNNDVTAFVTPATEYAAASYILNDINASHDITVTFTAKEGSGVVAPEFRFEGDNLTMSTTTQNASIFYKMADLPSMDEAVVDSVVNNLVVTADAIHSTYYEQPFELKKNAVVKAIAVMDGPSGMVVSDTTMMVYDYEAWMNLKAAVTSGVDLYDRAKGNPNVDAQLLEDLQWALNEGDMIYNQRAQMDSFEANHFTQRINELCAQIEAQMAAEDEPYAVLSTDGLTVTFYYDTQKNARGGIDINNSYLQEDMPSPYGTATTAVFDASFANYRPVSTAHWFQHCRSLTSITNIEYLNTVNVTEMTAMFHKCSSLPSLNLSNFNTSNVTDMTAMFGDCSGLTSLDLSNFNTTNVTGMNGMFAGCSGLTNIDLSNFNTTNVMDMSLMFHSCSGLTSLDLSNFNTAKVTNMESMFRYCSELKTIYIGNEWSTNAVEFGSEMFDGCTNLVGGAGTVYDANHTDHTYAHIDGGEGNPGYFTDKNPVEASYYDHVLYVGGSVTLAEAMQKFGTNKVVETIAAIVWNSSQAISTSELQVITNPNLLIYVQDASLAPANRDNVVINGFAKNVVLSDVTSGNNNFYCPEDFMAEAISYTRNFQQQTEVGISRGWESIALPFDVQTIMHEKNGALAPFGSNAVGKPFWLRQLSENGLVQAIEIHANRPYLISMPNSTDYPAEFNQPGRVTFSSLNVRVPVTEEEAVAMADSTIVLIPTFQRMEQSDWIYALNVGETRAQYPEGSVFEQGLRAVRPFEAFTVHNNNQSNPAPRYIAINEIGNGTLGIDATLVNREEVNSEEWYSLDGRKLQGKPAQKGIYIQNGKKVIIK